MKYMTKIIGLLSSLLMLIFLTGCSSFLNSRNPSTSDIVELNEIKVSKHLLQEHQLMVKKIISRTDFLEN
jgi:hypothetical protein